MRFTKMHGLGNDYVFINCFAEPIPEQPEELARKLSHRHFGIGSDGLILICPSPVADAEMRIWNADGSSAEMCGNGLRCVAKYLYEHGIVRRNVLTIQTGKGVQVAKLHLRDDRVVDIRVNMGPPILEPELIPTTLTGSPPLNAALELDWETLNVCCVSMGNPHCVVFVEELDDELLYRQGPQLESHEVFPERINVEFVRVISRTEIEMSVWERGSGPTLACGSGACAAWVAAVLTGQCEKTGIARLSGGVLQLDWTQSGDVWMSGPAEEVFSGELAAEEAFLIRKPLAELSE